LAGLNIHTGLAIQISLPGERGPENQIPVAGLNINTGWAIKIFYLGRGGPEDQIPLAGPDSFGRVKYSHRVGYKDVLTWGEGDQRTRFLWQD
jgi:hypothetical protein